MQKVPFVTADSERQAMQIAKGIAILAVVAVHALAFLPDEIYTTSDYRLGYIFLNQLARFSVPLFLAVSGFGLARKYQTKSVEKRMFMWSRTIKLLPQYILWSLILFGALYFGGIWNAGDEANLLTGLLHGNLDYHLYFVPLIFQFYLLFSVVLSRISSRRQLAVLVAASGLLQFGWFLLIRFITDAKIPGVSPLLDDQLQYRQTISWIFYFLLGIFLAQFNLDKVRQLKFAGLGIFTAALLGLCWSVFDSAYLVQETGRIVYATSFIRLPVLLYASSIILAAVIYAPLYMNFQVKFKKLLLTIGKYSYVIYLSHTLFLRIIEGIFSNEPLTAGLINASILFIVGIALSLAEMRSL